MKRLLMLLVLTLIALAVGAVNSASAQAPEVAQIVISNTDGSGPMWGLWLRVGDTVRINTQTFDQNGNLITPTPALRYVITRPPSGALGGDREELVTVDGSAHTITGVRSGGTRIRAVSLTNDQIASRNVSLIIMPPFYQPPDPVPTPAPKPTPMPVTDLQPEATVIASAESVLPGGQVIVVFSKEATGNAGDYISLWEVGGLGQNVSSVTPEQSGQRVFTMPARPGVYEFRLNSGTVKHLTLGKSEPITVREISAPTLNIDRARPVTSP